MFMDFCLSSLGQASLASYHWHINRPPSFIFISLAQQLLCSCKHHLQHHTHTRARIQAVHILITKHNAATHHINVPHRMHNFLNFTSRLQCTHSTNTDSSNHAHINARKFNFLIKKNALHGKIKKIIRACLKFQFLKRRP